MFIIRNVTQPGFDLGAWSGVMVPARTPPAVIRKLHAEITRALQDQEMRGKFAALSAQPKSSSPEQYGAYLRSELERWSRVIKAAGVKVD